MLAAFAVALGLIYVTTSALVFGIALSRTGPHAAELVAEAMRFALSSTGVMACALLSATALAVVAIGGARLETPDVRTRLRASQSRASHTGFIAAVLGMIALSVASAGICDLVGIRSQGAAAAIARALQGPTPARFVLALATIAIAPGMAEESFFRGFVQTRLVMRWGRWPAICVTAFAFGLVHLDFVQGAVAFVAGLFLGWVVEILDGIRPAVVAHAANNAAFVAVASFGSASERMRFEIIAVALVSLAVAIGSIAVLRSPLALRAGLQPPRQ